MFGLCKYRLYSTQSLSCLNVSHEKTVSLCVFNKSRNWVEHRDDCLYHNGQLSPHWNNKTRHYLSDNKTYTLGIFRSFNVSKNGKGTCLSLTRVGNFEYWLEPQYCSSNLRYLCAEKYNELENKSNFFPDGLRSHLPELSHVSPTGSKTAPGNSSKNVDDSSDSVTVLDESFKQTSASSREESFNEGVTGAEDVEGSGEISSVATYKTSIVTATSNVHTHHVSDVNSTSSKTYSWHSSQNLHEYSDSSEQTSDASNEEASSEGDNSLPIERLTDLKTCWPRRLDSVIDGEDVEGSGEITSGISYEATIFKATSDAHVSTSNELDSSGDVEQTHAHEMSRWPYSHTLFVSNESNTNVQEGTRDWITNVVGVYESKTNFEVASGASTSNLPLVPSVPSAGMPEVSSTMPPYILDVSSVMSTDVLVQELSTVSTVPEIISVSTSKEKVTSILTSTDVPEFFSSKAPTMSSIISLRIPIPKGSSVKYTDKQDMSSVMASYMSHGPSITYTDVPELPDVMYSEMSQTPSTTFTDIQDTFSVTLSQIYSVMHTDVPEVSSVMSSYLSQESSVMYTSVPDMSSETSTEIEKVPSVTSTDWPDKSSAKTNNSSGVRIKQTTNVPGVTIVMSDSTYSIDTQTILVIILCFVIAILLIGAVVCLFIKYNGRRDLYRIGTSEVYTQGENHEDNDSDQMGIEAGVSSDAKVDEVQIVSYTTNSPLHLRNMECTVEHQDNNEEKTDFEVSVFDM
ncbi:hypothetical protein DPMN_079924 [Dreissena polymorpha]|uniref:C-type lectin domain-containing protein n=1 Tax=Dreissena polymorpha TaxID=45954 RepID=A0A9D3YVD5_DREPO|nr:hypothetical protein DPMN_079924 [Dreissena polymorpha]